MNKEEFAAHLKQEQQEAGDQARKLMMIDLGLQILKVQMEFIRGSLYDPLMGSFMANRRNLGHRIDTLLDFVGPIADATNELLEHYQVSIVTCDHDQD